MPWKPEALRSGNEYHAHDIASLTRNHCFSASSPDAPPVIDAKSISDDITLIMKDIMLFVVYTVAGERRERK